jgi:hypothetical protein
MFVDRVNGEICGSYASPQHEGQEELPDDSSELAAFFQRISPEPIASTPTQKLEAIGLSVADLKQLLGIA